MKNLFRGSVLMSMLMILSICMQAQGNDTSMQVQNKDTISWLIGTTPRFAPTYFPREHRISPEVVEMIIIELAREKGDGYTAMGVVPVVGSIYFLHAYTVAHRKTSIQLYGLSEYRWKTQDVLLQIGPQMTYGSRKDGQCVFGMHVGSSLRRWQPHVGLTVKFLLMYTLSKKAKK